MENLNQQICSKCYMFYGKKENNFMCSKCFREIKSNQTENKINSEIPKINNNEIKEEPDIKEEKINKSKCNLCNKRLGLLGIECVCKNYFCKKHRLPETHDCKFDFKKKAKEELALKNPKLIEKKINKF